MDISQMKDELTEMYDVWVSNQSFMVGKYKIKLI